MAWRDARGGSLGIVAFVTAITIAVAWQRAWLMDCPDVRGLSAFEPGVSVQLLDRHGRRFAELTPFEHESIVLGALPAYVPEAFIAVEDKRFRSHHGIDLPRVAGALWANLRAGRAEQGSSTITMQLARSVFPERLPYRQRTLARKLLEARVAQKIEGAYDKDQILELYLNHIYFGSGAYGIEAAARRYFAVGADRLSLAQAALLAALPKSPTHYDPREHPELAKARRDLVLSLMEKQERIGSAEASRARAEPLSVAAPAVPPSGPAAYFAEEVRHQLEERLGEGLYQPPLRVFTTLDLDAQEAAEQELQRQLEAIERGRLGPFKHAPGELQGAFVALEVATGDVLAWVGGRAFRDSRFDRVRAASRQTGSAFKPFVYAAALESGQKLTRALSDEPLLIRLDERRRWQPRNYEDDYDGVVTLRDALVRSKNVPTVRLAAEVGYEKVAALAERVGFAPPIPTEPSMALGTVSVSPLELTAAYTTFASLGSRVEPRLITRVERLDGAPVLSVPAPRPHPVLGSAIAYLITDVLGEAITRGTGASVRAAGFRGLAAGKTGTTSDGADAWFVGYTPDVAATVWIGFDDVRPILPRASGGRLAAPVWGRIMTRLYKGRPTPRPWVRPADVAEVTIDRATGFAVPFECVLAEEETRRELFLQTTVPTTACPSASPALQTVAWSGRPAEEGADGVEPARFYVPFDPNPNRP